MNTECHGCPKEPIGHKSQYYPQLFISDIRRTVCDCDRHLTSQKFNPWRDVTPSASQDSYEKEKPRRKDGAIQCQAGRGLSMNRFMHP